MALVICPKCGKKVSDKAEKCPHCGCIKEELLKSAEPVEKVVVPEKQSIVLPLAGYELKFNKNFEDYIMLRRMYEPHAQALRRGVREFYDRTSDFGTIIERVPKMIETVMSEIIDVSMKFLYERNIQMTPGAFIEKYYDNYDYGMDYDRIISNVVEKNADILGEKESLERYRSMQKASRSRWQGGGFGLGGAMKGALMAGALNAGTDFVRSFGDSTRKNSDNSYIQQKILGLKNSDYARGQIIGGAYSVIIGVFFAVVNELREHGQINCIAEKEKYDEAKNICEAAERYETDKEKLFLGYLNAILKYPYYERPYRLIYDEVQNTDSEGELYAFLDYFGMDIVIGGILPSEYMDIDRFITKDDISNSFKYEEILPEQFYWASETIDELKRHYKENVLRKNLRYRKLCDYVKKSATEETLSYESDADKQLPMIDYIQKIVDNAIRRGQIEERLFYGNLWVWDVIQDEPLNSSLREIFHKFDKVFILVYDTATFKPGKRGFGIFLDGIVLFETGDVVLFRDIVECKYNESNFSFILKTVQQKTYEFEYKFFGAKILRRVGQNEFDILGKAFTGIIDRIIRHGRELNQADSNND